jgi:2-deoxy-D-gluconate 3-dehydrogenase
LDQKPNGGKIMNLNKFDLTGKTAVVFGGGGGLGEAMCLGLAEAGADVIPTSRSEERIGKTAKKIEALGRKSLIFPTDVCEEKQVQKFVVEVVNRFGKIDILINAVGMNVKKAVIELTVEEWERVIKSNLTSMFISCKYCGQVMVENKYGRIINIASLGSYVGIMHSSAYCASKGGVIQLTKVLALELADYNINVNAIAPGYFKTELSAQNLNNKELYGRITSKIAKGRTGLPEELAGTVVYLASGAADYVTGETIVVDGGFLAFGF